MLRPIKPIDMDYVKLYKGTEKYLQNMSPEEVKSFILNLLNQ